MAANRYKVIILAGDRGTNDPVACARNVARKVLASIAGKPMLEWVFRALRSCDKIGNISVIANDIQVIKNQFAAEQDIVWLEGDKSPALSVYKALEKMGGDYPILIVTADAPLLSKEILNDFITKFESTEADLCVGLAAQSNIETVYLDMPRTYFRMKGDGYSGCNLFAFRSALAKDVVRFWVQIERNRKKSFKIVAAFGLWNLILVSLKRVTILEAFERVSKRFGVVIKPIILNDPKASIDVDRVEHIALVEQILNEQ